MKFKVNIVNEESFSFYGDIVPTIICHNGLRYKVNDVVYDEDEDEYYLEAENTGIFANTDEVDKACLQLIKEGCLLQAVKFRKKSLNIGLEEAKDWVDAHR